MALAFLEFFDVKPKYFGHFMLCRLTLNTHNSVIFQARIKIQNWQNLHCILRYLRLCCLVRKCQKIAENINFRSRPQNKMLVLDRFDVKINSELLAPSNGASYVLPYVLSLVAVLKVLLFILYTLGWLIPNPPQGGGRLDLPWNSLPFSC